MMKFPSIVISVLALTVQARAAPPAPSVDRVLPAVVKVKAISSPALELSNEIILPLSSAGSLRTGVLVDLSRSLKNSPLEVESGLYVSGGQDVKKLETRVAAAQKRLQAAKKKGGRTLRAAQQEYDAARKALRSAQETNRPVAEVTLLSSSLANRREKLNAELAPLSATQWVLEPRLVPQGDGKYTAIVIEGGKRESEGTGFIWRADGYLVTASQIVSGANQIEVTMPSGQTLAAKLIVNDAVSGVAVLKVEARDLPVVALGDSTRLRPGEAVFPVGNTAGFTNTVLTGIVSGLDRKLALNDQNMDALIQTNIVLPEGFAGGPLVNRDGEVVGISYATYKPSAEGAAAMFSFALPLHDVKPFVEEAIATGKIERAFLGLKLTDLDEAKRSLLKLGDRKAVMVEAVYEGSPAVAAGLVPGDIVVRIDEQEIASHVDVPRAMRHRKPGDRLALELWRNGIAQRVELTAIARPDNLVEVSKPVDPMEVLLQQLLQSKRTDDQIVEALHLAVLGRLPTDDERKTAIDQLGQAIKQKDRAAAFSDFLFALTRSKEFLDRRQELQRHEPLRSDLMLQGKPSLSFSLRGALQRTLQPAVPTLNRRLLSPDWLVRREFQRAIEQTTPVFSLSGHSGIVLGLAMAPDAKTLASIGFDKTVRIWDSRAGALARELSGHGGTGFALAFSPDGKLLASGAVDRVRLWDVQTGAEVRRLSDQESAVRALAFSPDGSLLASGSDDHSLCVYDVQTGAAMVKLIGHSGYVMAVAFSPDGKLLASASTDRTVRLWDPYTGAALRTLAVEGAARSVTFSPDGKALVSGGDDQAVRLWDTDSGRLLWKSNGHTKAVTATLFLRDGKTVISAGYDGAVRQWDARTGTLFLTTVTKSDRISSLAISPDGSQLVIGTPDGAVQVWELAPNK